MTTPRFTSWDRRPSNTGSSAGFGPSARACRASRDSSESSYRSKPRRSQPAWPSRSGTVSPTAASRRDAKGGPRSAGNALELVTSRPGANADASYYLDLGTSSWEAVEIKPEGCRIVSRPPVSFRRLGGLDPLPTPSWDTGGSLDLLKKYTNVADADFPLLVAWMTAAMRPVGPYPILVLGGEQGSAKSTMARILRGLIDPSSAPLRGLPGNQRDLIIEALNSWLLVYDNVSAISAPLSDALCRIATGGGFSTRAPFSDYENTVLDVQRPLIFTGIDDFIRRSDLLDRCLFLHLLPIPEHMRRTEQQIWKDFEADRPRILGVLLMAVSGGLRLWSSVQLPLLPRMADFAQWGEAVCQNLGWDPGVFLPRYKANRRDACASALEDCPVTAAVREIVDLSWGPFEGTASDLYSLASGCASRKAARSDQWPRTANVLGRVLRRIAPQLRQIGIVVEFERGPNARIIRIASEPYESLKAFQTYLAARRETTMTDK